MIFSKNIIFRGNHSSLSDWTRSFSA